MEAQKHCVYLHRNPATNQVFYVGIGARKDRSYFFHHRNRFWKSYVSKHGQPIVEIIEWYEKREDAEAREIQLIKQYGKRIDKTGQLVNICDGGGGIVGYRHTDEAKAAIGRGLIGRKVSDKSLKRLREDNPSFRPEVKEKIRLSKIGVPRSAETIAKMSKNAGPRRPEVAAKIAAALTGRIGALNGRSRPVLQIDKNGVVIALHESILQADKNTGSDFRLISAVCNGKRKTHNGYVWKFKD